MRSEVSRILAAHGNLKHRILLTSCYGCELRVSELVSIQVRHLDGERRLQRITRPAEIATRLHYP